MRYTTGRNTEPSSIAPLDAAQDESVFIEKDQQEVPELVSAQEYERLNATANLDFQEFCDQISDEVIATDLTDAELNDLLNNG
jgi:hypothetical protein